MRCSARCRQDTFWQESPAALPEPCRVRVDAPYLFAYLLLPVRSTQGSEQRESYLLFADVHAERLAELGVPRIVQDIVGGELPGRLETGAVGACRLRTGHARGLEQRRGLVVDNAVIRLFVGICRSRLLHLEHLPFGEVVESLGEHGRDLLVGLGAHDQLDSPGKPEITQQHRGGGSEKRADRRAAAALRTRVGHVVVHEGRVVQQFAGGSIAQAVGVESAQSLGHEQAYHRTQAFARRRENAAVDGLQQLHVGAETRTYHFVEPRPVASEIFLDLLHAHNRDSSSSMVSGKEISRRDSS